MSSSKIAAAVAVCAAVYACAYGGLVYYQGQKFQEYASDLPKYLGSEWKSVKVNITDNGFFSKEFIVLNKNAQPKDKDTVTLPGKVKFGWSPESEITIKGEGNEVFKKVVEAAQPVLKTSFNYRFIPKLFVFSSKAVETTVDGETFKIGAIQSQALPKLVKQADGSLLIENLDSSVKTDIFSLASEESNVALSNPEFKFSVKGGNLKAAALSFSVSGIDYRDSSTQFTIGKTLVSINQSQNKSEITEGIKITFDHLKVGGFLKVGIDSWNTGLTAHFPPEPLLFDFLVQEAFGTNFCTNFPLICSPEPINEAQAKEILRNGILAGKTWAAVEPSEIKVGKESLSFSGQLKKQPEGNTLGSVKFRLQTSDGGLGQFALMALPRNSYLSEGKGVYTTEIVPTLTPNGDLILTANGVRLF